MRISAVLGCAACLLLTPAAQANPLFPRTQSAAAAEQAGSAPVSDTAADYSHAIALGVSGRQGVVAFRLPQAVYLHSRSADLDDVRVFDANGAKLPFSMYSPPLQQRTERRSLPVKIFPVTSSQPRPAPGDAIDLDIRTGPDGTVLSVKTKAAQPAAGSPAAPLAGLVLDVRQPEAADERTARPLIDALRFTLPPGLATYSAQVWLEVSDDLKQWQTIGAAELSWLVNGDAEKLANDRLEFEPRSFRYARLSWRKGEPVLFAALSAETVRHSGEPPALEQLLLQPKPGKEAGDLVYAANIAMPVEKAGLQFAEPNVVLPAALGAYTEIPSRQIGQPATWRFRPITRATFYQITQQGETRRSGDILVPLTHRAEWVLRPQIESAGKPLLRLGWQPATLVFLASGRAPYTLAFGRDKVKPAQLELSQVAPGFSAQELVKLEQASAGALQVHAAPGRMQDDSALIAGTTAHTRMLILWGVLLFGVAVLCGMGWRLMKQMKQSGNQTQ